MGSSMPGALNPSYSHGLSHTPEYKTWQHVKDRCLNRDCKAYGNYGGRGIKVYGPWVSNFKDFYDYLGPKPSPAHSIERIDNNGNYEPGNVIWATDLVQTRNRRVFKTSRSQVCGVRRYRNKWMARISLEGKEVYLGLHSSLEEAMAVRKAAELRYWKQMR